MPKSRMPLAALLSLLPLVTAAPASPPPPNILFILCDDLGWGDLGVFYQNDKPGTRKFVTPNLDTFAAEGVQLRSHYCPAPVCAPSRASMFLGVHQGHANVRNNQFDKALENNHNLATTLRQAGYATSLIGKWGLQGEGDNPATWPAYPTKRGFDDFFGYVRHVDGHTQYPFHKTVDPDGSGKLVRPPMEVYDQDSMVRDALERCYSTDLFTARAKKWIIDHRAAKPAKPFFLFLSYSTPHAALQVPSVAYPAGGGLTGGLQWTDTPGKMINTATGTIDSFIHPDYAGKSWSNNEKRFATMVRRIDDCLQDLVQTLRDLEIDDQTLIVFTSDNGPHHESYFNTAYEANSFHSFGPLDGTKRDLWEGGVRVPSLVRWPGTIPPGRISDTASQFHDWLPTLSAVAGLPAPARSDGVSLLPDLTGAGTRVPSTIYVEYFHEGTTKKYSQFEADRRGRRRNQMQLIHVDGFKGIRYDITSHATPFEIYNLNHDPKETTNLAASLPDLQQKMKDAVLQLRRPDGSAARPYDSEFVPAVNAPVSPGVDWKSYSGPFPWVPDFAGLTPLAEGTGESLSPAVGPGNNHHAILFSGYLSIPADGDYTFHLTSSGGAHLRIHGATVIDDDFARSGAEVSGTIRLAAGLHPYRLHYLHVKGTPSLSLQWSSPEIPKQPVPAAHLKRSAP